MKEKDRFFTKTVKLKNRRAIIGRGVNSGDILLRFKRLREGDDTPEDYSMSTFFGKVVRTDVTISKSAAVALYLLLKDELKLSDIIEFEQMSGQKIISQ